MMDKPYPKALRVLTYAALMALTSFTFVCIALVSLLRGDTTFGIALLFIPSLPALVWAIIFIALAFREVAEENVVSMHSKGK